jgi:hypothetical protein
MDSFAELAAAKQRPYFEETASRRSLSNTAMEKDFWVCWCLKRLFELRDVPQMCFKGGTSLSKAFDLIRRFSEDIDISLDRRALGFVGDRDIANPNLTKTKLKDLEKELQTAIENTVRDNILPKLRGRIEANLGKEGWAVDVSDEPNEEMTLVFRYPASMEYKAYLRPQIKIEFQRADQEPSQNRSIKSYVADEFPNEFSAPSIEVLTLDYQRTFWEKVTVLHAENHRPDLSKLKPFMSRHWSDIAVMSADDRLAESKLDVGLLHRVVGSKKIYFAAAWMHYDTAVPGTLSIVPNQELQGILRKDYDQMKEMLWGEPLSFDEILNRLKALETRLNKLKMPG